MLYTLASNTASPSQPYLTSLGEEGTATDGVSGPWKAVAQGRVPRLSALRGRLRGLHTHTYSPSHTHSIDLCVSFLPS